MDQSASWSEIEVSFISPTPRAYLMWFLIVVFFVYENPKKKKTYLIIDFLSIALKKQKTKYVFKN